MAWRIHEHVLRGDIDNRTRGCVTGRVWLAGVEQPLLLELNGDCMPDLAGCELTFENPNAVPMSTKPPALRQRGPVGDITAARKVRVFDVPISEAMSMIKRGETPPEHMANGVYLEWFSDSSGHVIIESADYRLKISTPSWRFTREEIAERERRAAEGDTPFAIAIHSDGETHQWDEARYEQFLRESDALTEKYGRLLEKYGDDPESERIIAREMGWKWLEEALADETAHEVSDEKIDESGEDEEDEEDDDNEIADEIESYGLPPPDPLREGIDWVRDERGRICHPIKKRADVALHALLNELRTAGHFPDCDDEQLGQFVGDFMTVTAKLAGALGGVARGDEFLEAGLVIAWLKRLLEILNRTLAASEGLAGKSFLSAESLERYRSELFGIRENILELIARLRAH
jgi:hypothetical protein